MKRLLALIALLLGISAAAQSPPEVAARAYLLLDVTANQVLAAKDIDLPVEPGSLTKLMSAYLVFDALRSRKIDLKQALPVSQRASKMPGSRMFIDPAAPVPVEDLIKGMVVQGGNDATLALAEGVGGSAESFVRMMNEQARALGMSSTGYRNPDGHSEAGHITTARDVGTLAARLVADFPQHLGYYAIKHYRYPGTPSANDQNRNLLLFRDPSVDGLVTGQTEVGGYCMVASARRDFPNLAQAGAPDGTPEAAGARRLLAIVLGADGEGARATEAQKLLNWGFTAFEAVKLFDAGQAVVEPAVWKGASATVKIGRFQSVVVAVPSGAAARLKFQVVRNEPLVAPLAKGEQLGRLRITDGDRAVAEVPLVALHGVDQAGILGRAWDGIRLWIR